MQGAVQTAVAKSGKGAVQGAVQTAVAMSGKGAVQGAVQSAVHCSHPFARACQSCGQVCQVLHVNVPAPDLWMPELQMDVIHRMTFLSAEIKQGVSQTDLCPIGFRFPPHFFKIDI